MKARLAVWAENLFVFTVGPVLIFLFSPKTRTLRWGVLIGGGGLWAAWWSGLLLWTLGTAVGLIPNTWLGPALTADEAHILARTLTESVDESHPVYQHTLRTLQRGRAFAELEGVPEGALAAGLWLHDVAQEHPAIPVDQRFCVHGMTGALLTARVLMQMPNRRPWMMLAVTDAVARHVGPTGYNWEWQDQRWVTKQCPEQTFAKPVSALSKLLYDVVMMDGLTVPHVVQRARQRLATDRKKDLQVILRSGVGSVSKELSDGTQTLHTRSGKACGKQVAGHARAFIKGLNFNVVKTADDLAAAAAAYLQVQPLPSCLDRPSSSLLEEPVEPAGNEDQR